MDAQEEGNMHVEARSKRIASVAAHPLAELLACPPATGSLLTASAETIEFDAGQTLFRQDGECQGLYLVVSGQLVRRAERLDVRVTLGTARPGDLVELAAALGDVRHTYSLVAQSSGSLLLLPMAVLRQAFQSYPPLRMSLLEELAREVSRAYHTCCMSSGIRMRRRPGRSPAA
jgi:CRP-like cAMP-binding protein